MVSVIVDGQEFRATAGRSLLSVCLANGIYIPHLCHLASDITPAAACRLCFVEIQGLPLPVTSCTIQIEAGMRVRTDSDPVRRLQRSALRLLLSAHHCDCRNCPANRACALQTIARFLHIGLRPRPLAPIKRSTQVDCHHPFIDHYPHRCVLCGKCVRICRMAHDRPQFCFAGRGMATVVRHYRHLKVSESDCWDCRQCIAICPVGALLWREGAH